MKKSPWIWMRSLVVLFSLISFLPAWASSTLYLTVERSFSDREKPEVRLDFVKSPSPLVVRVLKPKDVDAFLAGQIQISRSYEEPRAALNPGHFVWKGVNRISNPLFSLRRLFSSEFLTAAGPGFREPLKRVDKRSVAKVPDEVVVKSPAGFDVVRELYVGLQRGGEKVRDQVPGFEGEDWGGSSYDQRLLTLDPLPGGLYLVQAVQGRMEAQALLQVSELCVQVKQSTRELLVRVTDRDLDPVSGVKVRVRDSQGRWRALSEATDDEGQLLHEEKSPLDGRLVVEAKDGKGRTAYVDTEFLSSAQASPGVFLFTDRPIFKPGEELFFKGIVRSPEQGKLVIPAQAKPDTPVSLRLASDAGDVVAEAESGRMSRQGSFSGRFALDEKSEPGIYRVHAVVGGVTHGGELRVRDYVKPTYYLKLVREEGLLRAGHTFRARVQAMRYAGGAATDARLEYYVYRKKFEAPAWVDDAGGGLATGNDYGGQSRSGASVNQPQRLFSSAEARMASQSAESSEEGEASEVVSGPFSGSWSTAPEFNEEGFADIEVTLPDLGEKTGEEWVYTLMVKSVDVQGSQAVLSKDFTLTLSEVVGSVGFPKLLVAEGTKGALLGVRASLPDGDAAANVSGVVELVLEQASGKTKKLGEVSFTTDAHGKANVSLPELDDVGRVAARARMVSFAGQRLKNPYVSDAAHLLVAGGAKDPVYDNTDLEILAERDVLSPGEKTRVAVLLPKGWGDDERGLAWITVAQDKVLSTDARALKGRVAWFDVEAKPEFGTGFFYTVTLPRRDGRFEERTLAFRVVQTSQILDVKITPENEVAEPLKNTKIRFKALRADGSPAAGAELAASVVDRAVYAVQSEFRPSIVDFFFPLPRLNLMTFSSDELQGYGYADEIRRPNFRLQAIKSQTTLLTRQFRDTAAWFPHVVTNAQGEAEVSFEMPANLTEWVVTVVAIDGEGRVGEAKGQFRTAADVVSTVALAPFLRKGDEVAGSVRFRNEAAGAAQLVAKTESQAGLTVSSPGSDALAVGGKTEVLRDLSLKAEADAGEALVKLDVREASGMRVGGTGDFPVRLLPSGLLELLSLRPAALGEARLQAAIPSRAAMKEVSVRAYYGLLGASLQAASRLVVYPYGCTEQLSHSTVPNLVVLDLLDKAGVKPNELGPYRETLERAKSHASFGIKKLIANQRESGGFAMWPTDPEPTVGATLVALESLDVAATLGFKDAEKAAERARAWVSGAQESLSPKALEALLVRALRARTKGAWVPWFKSYRDHVQVDDKASFAELTYSLVYLNGVVHHFPNLDFGKSAVPLRAEVSQRLSAALAVLRPESLREAQRIAFSADGDFARSELGFMPGVAALVATAAGALADVGALTADVEGKVRALLIDEMRDGYWRSTYDSARVIYAARTLLAREVQSLKTLRRTANGPEVRTRDGAVLGRLEPMPGGFAGRFEGQNRGASDFLELSLSNFPAEARAEAELRYEVPLEDVTPGGSGMSIDRDLFVVGTDGLELLRPGAKLKVGDTILSKVRVSERALAGDAWPSRFLVIEDPVPSFAEAVEDESLVLADAKVSRARDGLAQTAQVLRHPEKTVRVVRAWPWVAQEYVSAWRVRFPGRVALPSAVAFDMYDERLRAQSAALVVEASR